MCIRSWNTWKCPACGSTIQYTKHLVAVNKCDKEEKWTEGDGTGEDCFYQEGRPATQNENVNKESGEEKNIVIN